MILPLHVDNLWPIPKDEGGFKCKECELLAAKWVKSNKVPKEIEGKEVYCSLCFITKTDWGFRNTAGIEFLTGKVSREMGRGVSPFSNEEDATRILSSIVMTSRMADFKKEIERYRR